ncbi:glycosyltransferase family 4 protein [Maridesulfovibrio salexigens]|uniref:Glycosyl transferase group 1 n=1 Tax=Maridesulfovibrio salexigens (strain ATCC 14822 / DSM 2638 / NCIMB 8403 / VKM B-1763) TaxID=526222 RepID=C6BXI1_MARSD|nr:glycosyltransferase family 4 protein [Maridesulfovibrio salexigens]ACS80487.1 glycosyl transferase group 1 [Maridesulfovibrio salexigens DSM 2638]
MQLLLVSTDLRHMGGVAETVKLLLQELEGRVDVTAVPYGRRAGQKGFVRYLRTFADLFIFVRLLCFNRFDVIHMNPSMNLVSILKEFALILIFFLFGYSGRILIFSHGWDDAFFKRISSGPLTSNIFRMILNRAGKVVVLAEEFKRKLGQAGINIDRVEVVSTMIDTSNVPRSSACSKDGKSLLFLSRMIRGKGAYELLEAFALLNERYDGLRLIMAGDGPEREGLMERTAALNLSNVSFPGYIQDMEKSWALENSCVFLLPSRSEGCPVSLLEAMASGLVPVVTGVGGIKDVIRPDQTALLLDDISAEAIAGAVAEVIDNPGLRMELSENARKYADENFSSRKVTNQIISFYNELNLQTQNGGLA